MNVLLNELSFSQQAQNAQDAQRLMLRLKSVLETISPAIGDGKRYIRNAILPQQQIQYGVSFREWITRLTDVDKELKVFFALLLGNSKDIEALLYEIVPNHWCIFNEKDTSFSTIAGGAHLGGVLICVADSPDFSQDTIQARYCSNGTDEIQVTITTIFDTNQIWGKHRPRFVPSPKHARGGRGTLMDLDDQTAQQVLDNSIIVGRQLYGYFNGKFYEFQNDNIGGFHGYPIYELELPPTAKEKLRKNGVIQ